MFRDETTGPLDEVNAAAYVTMLRRVREIGGFAQILFITHDEAADLADAQIRLADGQPKIFLPPFAEAA
jgi:ABC-type lipoprotein export system ATPase subunit